MRRQVMIIIVSAIVLSYYGLSFSQEELKPTEPLAEGEEGVVISLDEASRLAIENNFDIQLIKYDTLISRAGGDATGSIYDTIATASANYKKDKLARTSTYAGDVEHINNYNAGLSKKLPTGTTIDLDYTNQRISSGSAFSSVNPSHESKLGVSVRQELGRNFFGIRDRGNVKVTQIEVENAQYTSLDRIEEQIAAVQKAYWDLVLQVERVAIEKEFLEQAKKLFDLNQEKFKDGRIEEPDLLDAQANYNRRENDFLLAQNLLATKENTLRLLLNINDDQQAIHPAEVFQPGDLQVSEVESLKYAFTNRYDYKRAMRDIEAKNIEVTLSKNALWPVIDLQASYARNGVDDESFKNASENISGNDDSEFSVGLNFKSSLERTEQRADRRAAEFQKAKAITALKFLERSITITIMDLVRHCNILRKVAANQVDIAQVQQKKLDAELKKFLSGRSDTDTIIRFQEDVISARWSAAEAKFNYYAAAIDLRKAKGSLLRKYFDESQDFFDEDTL